MIKLGCVHSQDMHDTTGHLVLVYFSGGIFSKKPEGIGYTVYRKKKNSAYSENYTKPTNGVHSVRKLHNCLNVSVGGSGRFHYACKGYNKSQGKMFVS